MWENKGAPNQQWEFTSDGYIVSRHSGMVLDIPKAEYANNVQVRRNENKQTYPCVVVLASLSYDYICALCVVSCLIA